MANKKNKNTRVILEIKEGKYFEFILYAYAIDDLIKQDKDIPVKLLRNFFNFFESYNLSIERTVTIEKIINQCYEYLKASSYDFYFKRFKTLPEMNLTFPHVKQITSIKINKVIYEQSLKDLLNICFSAFVSLDPVDQLNMDKKKKIEFIFSQVRNYTDRLNKKNALSSYSIHVITGVIASSLGIIHTKDEYSRIHKTSSDYNKYLYNQVRNNL
jgi:hypothetical protein